MTTSNSSGFLICKEEIRPNDLKTLDSFLKCYDHTDTPLIFVDLKKMQIQSSILTTNQI